MTDRATVFIDGNNWYHSIVGIRIRNPGGLDYGKISKKLLGPRQWVGTRYYIGRVPQTSNSTLYAEQRRFLAGLLATDSRISTHLGRLESRSIEDPAANELQRYLANLPTRIDSRVYQELHQIAKDRQHTTTFVEKAVDVMIAVDMVVMSERNEFDAAYLLSADGDFTPAVEAVRNQGKKVYAASPAMGAQLGAAVNSFIPIARDWFDDCY